MILDSSLERWQMVVSSEDGLLSFLLLAKLLCVKHLVVPCCEC
jgi:hypothetical protein